MLERCLRQKKVHVCGQTHVAVIRFMAKKITFFNEYDYQLHCYRSHMTDKTVFKSAALPQNMLGAAARCLVEFFEYLSLSGGFFFLVGR